MQNAVVFNTYCMYISCILGTNLVYTIKAAERLNIWLNSTNLYINGLTNVKKGLVKNPRYANSGDTCYGVALSFSESRFWQNIIIGTELTAFVYSPSNTQI